MLLKPRFSPLREAVLRERSRPPQGTPAPETASARSPRPLAVTPPPAPAPPARATPRGPPPKLASRASPAKNAGFRDSYVPSWRPPRPEKRLHPREGGLKFGQKLLVWPAAQALRSGGARPEATSAQSLGFTSRIELPSRSPTRFSPKTFSEPRAQDAFTFPPWARVLPRAAAHAPSARPCVARQLRESDPDAAPALGARGRNSGAESAPNSGAESVP